MKKLNLKGSAFKKGEVLTRSELKKVVGGAGSGSDICDSWRSNPETCYNCCITVNSMDYCASVCVR